MPKVPTWVKELVEEVDGGCPIAIGQRWKINGKICQIVGGQYWGEYGVSNFWYWKTVNEDGSLGAENCGYGRHQDWERIS